MLGIEAIHEVNREHAQMFVEEFDVAIVDTLRDVFADLVGRSSLDHVQSRPTTFGLCARRCSYEEVVLQLTLQIVLFDMIRQSCWYLPEKFGQDVGTG